LGGSGAANHIVWRAGLVALFVWVFANSVMAACRDDTVLLRGAWGQARFSIEVAETFNEKNIGLMNRPSMPSASGMLFLFDTPRPLSFWMRNTLIELDMLFVDSRGVVTHIHHRAQPHDETPILGGVGVAVLEINGGLARSMGISVGTELRHNFFQKDDPAWAC
jgi:uncharacterized membrane protein (UPF0127 family)